MDAPTTQQEIKAAYRRLYCATANAMQQTILVAAAKFTLTECEAQNWPGGNETERKAARMTGTQEVRRQLFEAEQQYAALECEQALAKIVVNELRELLRLAEWHNGPPYIPTWD
jgi:hypothetical protein